jgi:hypothetical protein
MDDPLSDTRWMKGCGIQLPSTKPCMAQPAMDYATITIIVLGMAIAIVVENPEL